MKKAAIQQHLGPAGAEAVVGSIATGLTATGSAQGDAYAMTTATAVFGTVAASTGAILQPADAGDERWVCNGGANALAVYPPVGGTINGAAANAALSVAAGKTAHFKAVGPLTFIAVVSA